MSKTYNNLPMSDADRARIERQDAAWTAPRLIFLCAVTLGIAFTVLYLAANQIIGPTFN